jgi:hypothetical protein
MDMSGIPFLVYNNFALPSILDIRCIVFYQKKLNIRCIAEFATVI